MSPCIEFIGRSINEELPSVKNQSYRNVRLLIIKLLDFFHDFEPRLKDFHCINLAPAR
jgi:hypothetical protein